MTKSRAKLDAKVRAKVGGFATPYSAKIIEINTRLIRRDVDLVSRRDLPKALGRIEEEKAQRKKKDDELQKAQEAWEKMDMKEIVAIGTIELQKKRKNPQFWKWLANNNPDLLAEVDKLNKGTKFKDFKEHKAKHTPKKSSTARQTSRGSTRSRSTKRKSSRSSRASRASSRGRAKGDGKGGKSNKSGKRRKGEGKGKGKKSGSRSASARRSSSKGRTPTPNRKK